MRSLASPWQQNPFVATTDPRRYVPRPATERALAALEHQIDHEAAGATLLVGPSGIGKSLLLRVLARRLRDRFRTVSICARDVDAPTLCTLLLDQLRVPPGDDPEYALAVLGADWVERGSALVVALDDAHALPAATAARLGGLVLAAAGGLRMAAAAPEATPALARMLGAEYVVTLAEPMDLLETRAYVQAALAVAWAPPELRCIFDRQAIAQLHAESGGVPGSLNERASARIAQATRNEVSAGGASHPPTRPDSGARRGPVVPA
jgi:type II secretory pathway predicted ATPase ExeA